MPCPRQFPLRAGIPWCICPCHTLSQPRMGSRMIIDSISRTYYHKLEKGLMNWYLYQSMSLYITQISNTSIRSYPISIDLRISYTIHVPTVLRSSSECVQLPSSIVSSEAENREIHFGVAFKRNNWAELLFARYKLAFIYSLNSNS